MNSSEWFNGFETHLDLVKYIYIANSEDRVLKCLFGSFYVCFGCD